MGEGGGQELHEAHVWAADAAGLSYVTDVEPGISRRGGGRGSAYHLPEGALLKDRREKKRVAALAITAGWTEAWIRPDPLGHMQATARDGKGRKQYRYHGRFRAMRDESKFGRMLAFCEALPKLREQIEKDMAPVGLPRRKLLATVVWLLDKSLIRVGNDEYVRENKSYGLTTMRRRHVKVKGHTVSFEFRGKSGIEHKVDVSDRRLATIVQQLPDLPGQQLFQYVDAEGTRPSTGSE